MSFNQISFQTPKRNESPSVNVRPPTEPSQANLFDWDCTKTLNGTSHDAQLPSSFESGDLLLLTVNASNSSVITGPAGWTTLAGPSAHSSFYRLAIYYKVATGSDTPGGTVTLTTDVSTPMAMVSIAFQANGIDYSTYPPDVGSFASGTEETTINPAAVTPSHGANDYLVLPCIGVNGSTGTTSTPTGYSDLVFCRTLNTSEPGMYVGQGRISVTTSEDPGLFPMVDVSAFGWGAFTVAVLAQAPAGELATGDHTHALSDGDVTDIDVTTTAPVIGDLLEWDGTDFVPQYRDRYVATASKTIANTTTETTLFGTGEGTLTFPADFFSAGRTVRFRLSGQLSDTGTPNQTIRIKLGGSTLTSETEALSGVSGVEWVLDGTITCRTAGASGTFIASALFDYDAGSEISLVGSSTTTLDTTGTLTFDLTWQWGTADASNTVTCQTAIVS